MAHPSLYLRLVCSNAVILPGWLHACRDEMTSTVFEGRSDNSWQSGRFVLQWQQQANGQYLWVLEIGGRRDQEYMWCLTNDYLAYDGYPPTPQEWFGRACYDQGYVGLRSILCAILPNVAAQGAMHLGGARVGLHAIPPASTNSSL